MVLQPCAPMARSHPAPPEPLPFDPLEFMEYMDNQQTNQETPDHVLVVDDDAEIRTLLAEYLSQNGIKVSVARDAH